MKLSIRKCIREDFPAVLDISKDIYYGLDYLPHVFHAWLDEETNDQPNRIRRSILLVGQEEGLDEKVLGFQTFVFQGDGELSHCLNQALRVTSEYRGRGLGKDFMRMAEDFCRDINPKVNMVKCVYDVVSPPNIINDPFMGQVISKRAGFLHGNVEKNFMTEILPNCPSQPNNLVEIEMSQFKIEAERWLESNFLVVEWTAYYQTILDTCPNYESKGFYFLTKDSNGGNKALSVLTMPYTVPIGIRGSIDIFTNDPNAAIDHYHHHVTKLGKYWQENKDLKDKQLCFQVFCNESVGMELMKYSLETLKPGPVWKNMDVYVKEHNVMPLCLVFSKSLAK